MLSQSIDTTGGCDIEILSTENLDLPIHEEPKGEVTVLLAPALIEIIYAQTYTPQFPVFSFVSVISEKR